MYRVLGVFCSSPTKEHYLKAISREINLAHTSVKMYLDELKSEDLILEKILIKGKRKFPGFTVNTENPVFKILKASYNLILLKESGLVELLYEALMPKCIVVFGSYIRGEDVEDSDIDIFIQSQKQEVRIAKFEKKLKRKIQLHFKSIFSEYSDELKNNIINGVVLKGFLEVF